MYNGIGLKTTRGTGTSGHIQRNIASIRGNKRRTTADRKPSTHKALRQLLRKNKSGSAAILAHESQRKIEVAVAELEEDLHERGYDDETIDRMKQQLRQDLENRGEEEKEAAEKRDLEDNNLSRNAVRNLQSHQVAHIQQHRNDRLKEAFGIGDDDVDEFARFDSSKEKDKAAVKEGNGDIEAENGREQATNNVPIANREENLHGLRTLSPGAADNNRLSSPSLSERSMALSQSLPPSPSATPNIDFPVSPNKPEQVHIRRNDLPDSPERRVVTSAEHDRQWHDDERSPTKAKKIYSDRDEHDRNIGRYSPERKNRNMTPDSSPTRSPYERSSRPHTARPRREEYSRSRERNVYKHNENYVADFNRRDPSSSRSPRPLTTLYNNRNSRENSHNRSDRYRSDDSRSVSPVYYRSRRYRSDSSDSDSSSHYRSRRPRRRRHHERRYSRSPQRSHRRRYDSSSSDDSRSPSPSPRYYRNERGSVSPSRKRYSSMKGSDTHRRYNSVDSSRYSEEEDRYPSARRKRSLSPYSSSDSRRQEHSSKRYRHDDRDDTRGRDYSPRSRRPRYRSPTPNREYSPKESQV